VTSSVRLTAIDNEEIVDALLTVAVAEAEPTDVMPPVAGPPGWTAERREAFRAFHRTFYEGLVGPNRTIMFGVVVADQLVGMIRLRRRDVESVETGMWLGRSARGRGIGTAALRAVVAEATAVGARTMVAETTSANHAALAALRRCGAMLTADATSDKVTAVLTVPAA
jgi:RimJ/RimL family protein N-acetyltransferase